MLMFPLRYTSIQNFRTICSACRIDGKISNKCCCWETAPFCLEKIPKWLEKWFYLWFGFWFTSASKHIHSMNLEWNHETWSKRSDYPTFSRNLIESELLKGNIPLFSAINVPTAGLFGRTKIVHVISLIESIWMKLYGFLHDWIIHWRRMPWLFVHQARNPWRIPISQKMVSNEKPIAELTVRPMSFEVISSDRLMEVQWILLERTKWHMVRNLGIQCSNDNIDESPITWNLFGPADHTN